MAVVHPDIINTKLIYCLVSNYLVMAGPFCSLFFIITQRPHS
jgi:hypothetical protein